MSLQSERLLTPPLPRVNSGDEPPYWFRDFVRVTREDINAIDTKVERLETRVNYLFAVLGVLVTLATIITPLAEILITKGHF